jgi:hypothetical protein
MRLTIASYIYCLNDYSKFAKFSNDKQVLWDLTNLYRSKISEYDLDVV